MTSFVQRSYQKELLDGAGIPFAHIRRNMQELDFINRHLGGHDITLDGVVKLIQAVPNFKKPLRITEIGCGGGDNLRAITRWAKDINLQVALTGIDFNAECIQYAASVPQHRDIVFICADYRNAPDTGADIIFSSLFCHHFTDEILVTQLQWMQQHSRIGFFINDLHRHPAAYYSIKTLTQLFSKSYLVKNDAPLSVRRGFVRADWERLFSAAGIEQYSIQWRWAFRWLITAVS